VVSTLSLAGGFLAAANIIKLDGAILIWVWPILVVVYAAGRSWASRRYGGDEGVMCNNGAAWYGHLLLMALVLAVIAWHGRNQLVGYQLGMLCGMSAAFAAWGLMLAIARRRGRQRVDHEAP
jgi:hypothetical protein